MSDHDMRTLLHDLANTSEPASTIDIASARRKGKRRLWLRNGTITAAAAAVVALAIVLPETVFSAVPDGKSGLGPVMPAASATAKPNANATGTFNPLIPYAAFGYIPQGFKIGLDGSDNGTGFTSTANDLMESVVDSGTSTSIDLDVESEGNCGNSVAYLNMIPGFYAAHHASGSCAGAAVTAGGKAVRVANVNGRPAYQLGASAFGWEYAPDSWAVLSVVQGSATKLNAEYDKMQAFQQLPKMASTLKLGQTRPIHFPYKLTAALPASWKILSVGFTVTPDGQYFAQELNVGPPGNGVGPSAAALQILDAQKPGWANQTCPMAGSSSMGNATVQKDGVPWEIDVSTPPNGDNGNAVSSAKPAKQPVIFEPSGQACARRPDNGLYVYLSVYSLKGATPTIDIRTIVDHLTVNANPKAWTTTPLAK